MWGVIGRLIGVCLIGMCLALIAAAGLGRAFPAPLLAYSMLGDLYVVDIGHGVSLRLTYDGQRWNDQSPAWSPDGRAVAFIRQLGFPYREEDREKDPDTEIYWMSLDGQTRVRLTDNDQNDVVPVWSPDGKTIAYLSDGKNGYQAMLIRPDDPSAAPQALSITFPQGTFTTLRWTPDSARLLFHRLVIERVRIIAHAYDLATGDITPLSEYETYYPAVSPNGERVAVKIDTQDGHGLAILEGDGEPRLILPISSDLGAVWQDDEHLLFLNWGHTELWRVNVESGEVSVVYVFPTLAMNFAYHR